MILRCHPLTSFLSSLLLLLLAASPTATDSKKDAPEITKFEFSAPPAAAPQYFEDSDVVLVLVDGTVFRSPDAGATFAPCPDVPEEAAWDIFRHKHEKSTAYIWGKKGTHWVSSDAGENWREFQIEGYPVSNRPPFSFHAGNPEQVIVNVCQSVFLCDEISFYTVDAFKTEAKELREGSRGCVWARGTPEWGSNYVADPEDGKDEGPDNDDRVACVVTGRFVDFPFSTRDHRLVVSDNFFKDEEEPVIEAGRTIQGIVNIAPVKGFLVAAASAKKTDELALYVSDDARQWHRAVFPQDHRLEEDAYTMLESTNYSIQVDVMTTPSPLNAMGVLFTSNSNGTYFTRNIEHTNRNFKGMVDFEKVTGVQGVVMVNVVDNWEDLQDNPLTKKKLTSRITFDDGRTFDKLTADGDEVHLHSVTDLANMGKVFSSPAPGLVMGIGNKGKYLKDYEDGDLYVSDDAGLTWSKALKNAHKFEFGDRGAVLVAIYDEGETDEIQYSINHGKDWSKAKLPEKVRAKILTTTPDSTSLKFFLMATSGEAQDAQHFSFSIDFSGYHKGGKCGEDDFEHWDARKNEKGEATCIMGQKQWYRRRKADSECFVDKEFEDPIPQFEPCPCTEQDFECDYNFVRSEDRKECVPSGALSAPEGVCGEDKDTFKSSSGFRLIPGNKCDQEHKDSINLDQEIERKCKDTPFKAPATGEISWKENTFKFASFREYHYLERTDKSGKDDETVLARGDDGTVWLTRDAANSWEQIIKDDKIAVIYPHSYMNDIAFFLTEGKKVYYTYNRGETLGHFKAPAEPTRAKLPILSFHPQYKDWLIWTGAVDCGKGRSTCHNVAFFSENRGATWPHEVRYVNKCEFVDAEGRQNEKNLVYCEQYKDEVNAKGQQVQLKWSDNWFADDHEVFGDISDFATMSEFIVVAARRDDNREALSCHASVDGKTFAHAQFPPSFEVPEEKGYTVLESRTHAVFLHVTVNNIKGSKYGALIKSNSNGTNYVMSLNGVNRDEYGYVDFEKMNILEGVMLANVVRDIEAADSGKPKSLQTVITHNDGSQWAPLKAPATDSEGKKYKCDISDVTRCSLHLHGYTERDDKRATLSSKSAVGLLIGVGNVGGELLGKTEGNTYISRDAGIEWQEIKKGSYMWAFGDSGSIIVIAPEQPTKSVFYSRDEGKTWEESVFAKKEMSINSLSSVPSDKSRNFIVWSDGNEKGKTTTFNLDFSGLADRVCELDENHPDKGDFYFWSPKHPMQQTSCLFGHIAQYHRKKEDADCYIGLQEYEKLHTIVKNCTCERDDFECDYNYERATDGSCQLVPGLTPADHSQQCRDNPALTSYHLPTGYRRVPLDTCSGGRELEYTSKELPCPNHEKEYEDIQRKKGPNGFWFFLLVFVLPVGIATAVGYWVYQNWDGKFGRIRLGDGGAGGGDVFDADKPWIKYPIMGISAMVAVAVAMPLVISSAWRGVMGLFGRGGGYGHVAGVGGGLGTYARRSDFSRGSRYAVGDDLDEDELLGVEDEETLGGV